MAHDGVISRFTDADEEPTKTLLPIDGYEKSRVVSLKDAVASIKTPIYNLNTMLWTAERNCENPTDGLTSNESASIHLYTMQWPGGHDSFYKLLNQKLRSEDRDELIPWFSYLKLFFTALYKLPSLKAIIWRGIRGNVSDLYKKDCIWWGVSSCTETMEIMQKFVGRSGIRTIFMIECTNGKSIRSHSFYKNENEIILMPGTYLRVVDKWSPAVDLYMVRLKEENPPYQFVSPPFDSSSSVDTLPLTGLSVSKPNHSDSQVASAQSAEPSPPQYKNPKLEQKINQKKNESMVDLSYSRLTDEDMEIVVYYLLRNNKILTELYLDNNQIGDNGAQYLGEGLQKNLTLTTLTVSSNKIGDNGAQYLGEGLQKNSTLITLNLSYNQIGAQGAQYLGEGLQKNSTLTELCLSENQIGDKGAEYLSAGLQKNSTLTILNLHTNQIGDKGAEYLGEGLQKNSTLTRLHLHLNQIGDKGAQYLGEGLQKNSTLTELYLQKNQIGAQGAQYLDKLKKKNKNLYIAYCGSIS